MRAFRCIAVASVALAAAPLSAQRLVYPVTATGTVVDDYHGTKVPDPFRWLEDANSKETAAWIASENALTFGYLDRLPFRDAVKRRLTELYNYPRTSLPIREGGRLFFRRNSGLQRQSVVYSVRALADEPEVVIDPNLISADGSTSLATIAPSPDGRRLAYALSEGGADWQVVHVRDLTTGRDLSDTVRWVRFSGISWTRDGNGFFYARYPERPKGDVLSMALRDQKVFYHRVGQSQGQDVLIYDRPALPTWFVGASVSDDGRWLIATSSEGTDPRNTLSVADLGDPLTPNVRAPLKPIVTEADAEYNVIGAHGNVLYVRTDLKAPNRRIVAVDVRRPQRAAWRTVVAERPQAMEAEALLKDGIVVHYLRDARSELRRYGLDGANRGIVALPALGTLGAFASRDDAADFFYSFSSPLYPSTVFHYDPASRRSTPFAAAQLPVDLSPYETRQVFYLSRDGTRVPMFITARKGVKLDGTNPTLLYAYGGFAISTLPGYRNDLAFWLEQGGVYATASLRGGGEYGEAWHAAGKHEKKQNVFDDFISAAEYLVKEKWTSPGKLAIQGGSNGGLLVGAVMEQRPDLFGVALPAVGVMDMLRYDQFTGGKAWVTEYGSASDPVAFQYLSRYSPLHNVRTGTCYPATFVTTADHDDRVVPSHSFKFTAAVQAAQSCDKPVVIRVETMGSHGYRPVDKAIAEAADRWAFTAANLDVPLKFSGPPVP